MPTINIYSEKQLSEKKIAERLRQFTAERLSGKDIQLKPEEISIRFIKSGGMMIGDVELEIAAHAFEERVKNQDRLANEFRDFLMKDFSSLGDVRVWLKLSELGHSF